MTTTPQQPQQPGQMAPGWPPSGSPPPGYAHPPQPERKRRRWPWIVGGITALLVVIGIAGGGDNNTSPDVAQPAVGAPAAAAPVEAAAESGVVYDVESDGGGTALITYTVDDQFNIAQENGAALPWTKTVDVGSGFFGGAATLSAQGDQSINSITCRVTRDGEVVSENTSTGQFAVVTCSGF